MRDIVVGIHADDSSDDENLTLNYRLSEHFKPEGEINWSKFNFLLGVLCLYQQQVSASYHPQKKALGLSTLRENQIQIWIEASVLALIKEILNNPAYTAESATIFEGFKLNYANQIRACIEALSEIPETLVRQLRSPKQLLELLETKLTDLKRCLSEFVSALREADITVANAQPLSFKNIADVGVFSDFIRQEASQFLYANNLMRAGGKMALVGTRRRILAQLRNTNLNLWQRKCFDLADNEDNANKILQNILDNNASTIITLWLREAFNSLLARGVTATADPEAFLIPAGFDFSNGPLASLFALRPQVFTNLFAKADELRASAQTKLSEKFANLAAEAFFTEYKNQKIKMRRALAHTNFVPQGILGLLASLRLLKRLDHRRHRNAIDDGKNGLIIEQNTAVNLHLIAEDPENRYAVLMHQKLTKLGSQTDLLPDLGSYKSVAEDLQAQQQDFNREYPAFILTDSHLAELVIYVLRENKFPIINRGDQSLDLNTSEEFYAIQLKKFITALACLLFVVEVRRHPAALVMHILMLDLIQSGQLSFKEALAEKMPMAMEAAVGVARDIHDKFRRDSVHLYRYPGASKANPVFNVKESALVAGWLSVFAVNRVSNQEKMSAVVERVQQFCGA